MSAKKDRFISCELIAVWPKLDVVDVYKPKKGPEKRRYVTDAKAAPGAEKSFEKMRAMIAAYAKKHLPDIDEDDIKLPFKSEKDKDKKETGTLLITASSGEKYKPPMFDAKNKRLPEGLALGGGSRIKLDLTLNVYEMSDTNSGVNLYINAVQVLDFVEKGVGKSNFEESEGFTFDDKDAGSFNTSRTVDDDAADGQDPLAF
jgi:hypothetical protein